MNPTPPNILPAIAGALLIASSVFAAQPPKPIVSYDFNATGATIASTGSDSTAMLTLAGGATISPQGAGVSGGPADRALDLSSSTKMGAGPGGIATRKPLQSLTGLTSFTLTGWFKTSGDSPLAGSARLFDGGSTFFLGGYGTGNLVLGVNGKNTNSTGNRYTANGSWVFFAVSYDGTKNEKNARFYTGAPGVPAALVGGATDLPAGALGKIGVFNLGNREINGFDRSFVGYLDDMTVYGSDQDSAGVLDLAQIQQVQTQSARTAR
jgi:hypothetical protein